MTVKSLRKTPLGAFTLIELLVVIAIIAILAAILLPVLSKVKSRGTEATCISNQKQLALAWRMYADDNQDRIINFDTVANSAGDLPWRFANPSPPASIPFSEIGTPQADILTLGQGYKLGGLYQYAPNVNVLHCPGDLRNNFNTIGPNPAGYSFAWGSYSGAGGLNGNIFVPGLTAITKQTVMLHPSERYLWVEENDPRGENESSWVMTPGTAPTFTDFINSAFIDSPASWHGANSTFSWADGHADSHHWLDPLTISFALNMSGTKYNTHYTVTDCPHDLYFLATGYASQQNP